ncbi:MAG: PP2C family protein-serine/threonine phosphatase, partial [Acidimicrobiales bacterium]
QEAGARLLESSSSLIGVLEEIDVSVHELVLSPGEVLVLYTDGVTEARAPGTDLFGSSRLLATIAEAPLSAGAIAAAIEAAVLEHAGPRRRDDLAILALGRAGT